MSLNRNMVTFTKAITVPCTKYKPPWKKSENHIYEVSTYSSLKNTIQVQNTITMWQSSGSFFFSFFFCKTVPYHHTKHIQYVDRTIYNMKAPSWTYIFFLQYFLFMHKGRDENREDCWRQRRHSLEIKATGKKKRKRKKNNNNKSKLPFN